jgi:hypothetical protein
MGDYQNGFRDGRSVIDNKFALKIINEKIWEYNQSVQYVFIDFQRHIISYPIISYIIYFNSIDPYRITKSMWIRK